MRPIVRRVQRLQSLAVFDAAARLGSFTAAARDLGISQPAVTRQIRDLEARLGFEVFERAANRVSLTSDGRRLADALDAGLTVVEHALTDISDADGHFVLASPPGFAQQLIVPGLDSLHDELHRVQPDADIRLWLYDRDADLESGRFDAAIQIGTGDWAGRSCAMLFAETVLPVATAALAAEWGLDADSGAADVLAAPLLHMDATDRPWMSWSDWLQPFGLALTDGGRRVLHNTYPIVLQQALAGRGVALGWRRLIDQYLDDGLLVAVGPELTSPRSYYVTWHRNRHSAGVTAIVDWMRSRCAVDAPE